MNFLLPTDIRRLALIGLLCLALAPAFARAASSCMPFSGERMQFSIDWEFINAGSADMSTSSDNTTYRVTSHGISNKFLDIFHKVRDTIISEGDCVNDKLQSTLFDVVQNEGRYHSTKRVAFLWRQNRVTHTQNGKTDSYDVPAGHLNAIDAFFRVRKMKLSPGMKIRIPIFDSRKRYQVVVDVLGRESLNAPWGGKVDCLIIVPRLKTEGIFSSKGTVKLWLSDDDRHIPLRMTAKVKIGRIIATLERYSEGKVR